MMDDKTFDLVFSNLNKGKALEKEKNMKKLSTYIWKI